jgi:hypothetical protein
VTELALDNRKRHTFLEKFESMGMAQSVRMDPLRDACSLG